MSIIFYHGGEQKKLAEKSLREAEKTFGARVYTIIIPFTDFTEAEEYHQKYYLKNDTQLLHELAGYYPAAESLTDSTAAARINGYLGSNGTLEDLKKEMGALGLSARGEERLLNTVKPRETGKAGKFLSSVLSACGLAPKKK